MKGRSVGLFKGLFTVVILSVVIYFVIFLFFPNTSLKYFGTAFNFEKAVEETVAGVLYNVDYLSSTEREDFNEYLSSSAGKAFIKGISEAIAGGREKIEEFSQGESFSSFVGTVSSILSPESYSRLFDNIENTASGLLEKTK